MSINNNVNALFSFDGYEFGDGYQYVYVIRAQIPVGAWVAGQPVYVGVTNNPAERWGSHIAVAVQRNAMRPRGMAPLVTAAFQQHGVASFRLDVISVCRTRAEALDCELAEIQRLQTGEDVGGCNSVGPGQDGSRTHSSSVRRKISTQNKKKFMEPEFRALHAARCMVANKCPERRAKVSIALKRALSDPAIKEKYAAGRRAYFAQAGIREKHAEAVRTTKADPQKRKEYSRKAQVSWDDPTVRARRLRLCAEKHLARALSKGNAELAASWRAKIDAFDAGFQHALTEVSRPKRMAA